MPKVLINSRNQQQETRKDSQSTKNVKLNFCRACPSHGASISGLLIPWVWTQPLPASALTTHPLAVRLIATEALEQFSQLNSQPWRLAAESARGALS